jgi:hypothetical protein
MRATSASARLWDGRRLLGHIPLADKISSFVSRFGALARRQSRPLCPISDGDAKRIRAALAGVRAAQDELEKAVAGALLDGASVRAVSELGLSPNTVTKYGRAHGWPTEENRLRFNESRWDRYGREDEGERSGR